MCNVLFSLKQEKQRAKIKEKLDKCVKEKLLVFCDILNIPVSRSASKKACIINGFAVCCMLHYRVYLLIIIVAYFTLQDELSVKLLDFLESPHSTTESLLAEKEQVQLILHLLPPLSHSFAFWLWLWYPFTIYLS